MGFFIYLFLFSFIWFIIIWFIYSVKWYYLFLIRKILTLVLVAVIECTGFGGNEFRKKVYRARFSSVTEKDILKALDNLVQPNRNEALAVDARQEIDLKVGVAFTRFQTTFFQGKYGNLDSRLISLVLFLLTFLRHLYYIYIHINTYNVYLWFYACYTVFIYSF